MNEEPFLKATSPDGQLTLGVFEEDDYLVGLRGGQWHTHGPLLVPEYGSEPKEAAIGFFESVVQDREIIVVSKRPGKEEEVWITQDADSDVRYMEEGESLSLRYWSGREIAHHRREANRVPVTDRYNISQSQVPHHPACRSAPGGSVRRERRRSRNA